MIPSIVPTTGCFVAQSFLRIRHAPSPQTKPRSPRLPQGERPDCRGAFALPRFSIAQPGGSPTSKLNIAMIGAGGIAGMAYGSCSEENGVALCDVEENKFGEFAKTFPALTGAKQFADFRVMLDKMDREIDAVCLTFSRIETPESKSSDCTRRARSRRG
jgi:hypothetical protein